MSYNPNSYLSREEVEELIESKEADIYEYEQQVDLECMNASVFDKKND